MVAARGLAPVRDTASYRQNVECLTVSIEYLVLNPRWIAVDHLDSGVAATVRERFDCGRALPSTTC